MKDAYIKLYEALSGKDDIFKRAQFVAIHSEQYTKQEMRFMLIGRAPNDWTIDTDESHGAAEFGQIAQEAFENRSGWDWLENRDGVQYSGSVCISKTPFWSYAKEIWRGLQQSEPCTQNTVWMKNILWSNLYKVSLKGGGNPTCGMIKLQQESCIEILKKEMDICKPTHVLIMSGYDWFTPFASIFEAPQQRSVKNIPRGKNKNNVFVEGFATYKGAKVVVACRPEMRRKKDYVEEVQKYFSMEPDAEIFR